MGADVSLGASYDTNKNLARKLCPICGAPEGKSAGKGIPIHSSGVRVKLQVVPVFR